jgi:hypothetical protein
LRALSHGIICSCSSQFSSFRAPTTSILVFFVVVVFHLASVLMPTGMGVKPGIWPLLRHLSSVLILSKNAGTGAKFLALNPVPVGTRVSTEWQ